MDHRALIDKLGGTCKVAEICGITTGAVSQWRTNGIDSPVGARRAPPPLRRGAPPPRGRR